MHVLWDGGFGGTQRYVSRLVSAFQGSNVQTSALLCAKEGAVINQDELGQDRCSQMLLENGWQLSKSWKGLQAAIKKHKPHILHNHCDSPSIALHLRKLPDVQFVYTEHGDTMTRDRRNWFTTAMWRRFGRFYDRIACNSHFSRKDFVARYPALEPNTIAIPLCLTEDVEVTRHWPRPPVVGFVGRLAPVKGIDRLLKAAAIVRDKVPSVRFVIYGDGDERPKLEELMAELNLEGTVSFQGFCKEPYQAMASMTCFALPSHMETFGLVALEAHHVGVPVVCFDETGVPEVIEDRRTGFVVPQGDIEGFAQAILRLVKDPDLAYSMGTAAEERARGVFGLEEHMRQLTKCYESVLAKH